MIEASTGCCANSLLNDDNPLRTLDGEKFSKQTLAAWRGRGLHEAQVTRTEADVVMRTKLLLRSAGEHSPGLYRSTLLQIKNALDDARENAGISFGQIRAVARRNAVSEDGEFTLEELDEKLAAYPAYQAERKSLDAKKKIKARVDRFPTWDGDAEFLQDGKDLLGVLTTTVEIWRIEKVDHQWFEVMRSVASWAGS